jgi:hypothetical protein
MQSYTTFVVIQNVFRVGSHVVKLLKNFADCGHISPRVRDGIFDYLQEVDVVLQHLGEIGENRVKLDFVQGLRRFDGFQQLHDSLQTFDVASLGGQNFRRNSFPHQILRCSYFLLIHDSG